MVKPASCPYLLCWIEFSFCFQVTFPEEDLPRNAGEYVLGYYSHNMNSIVGITEPFQVELLGFLSKHMYTWNLQPNTTYALGFVSDAADHKFIAHLWPFECMLSLHFLWPFSNTQLPHISFKWIRTSVFIKHWQNLYQKKKKTIHLILYL